MLKNKVVILWVVCFALLSCGGPVEDKPNVEKVEVVLDTIKNSKKLNPTTLNKIDAYISSISADNNLSGAFLFSKQDKFYANAFGKARDLNGKDVKVEDVFQLASVSKLVTALCILKLVEEEKLHLKDKLEDLIPEFQYRNVTVHQLLTHTSGLPEYTYLSDQGWLGDSSSKCNKDACCLLIENGGPAYYNPGKRFNYRNTNYMLLAYLAELKTGMSFSKIVQEYIALPAGLDSLHVLEVDKRGIEDYPVWGMRGDHSFIPDHPLNHICGDKSVYANVYDLFHLYKAIMENKIISSESKKLLFKPHVQVKKVNPQYYCYGLRKTQVGKKETWYFHNGWWHGFRSYFWFNPEKDKCAILLTNRLKGGFINTHDMVGLLANE